MITLKPIPSMGGMQGVEPQDPMRYSTSLGPGPVSRLGPVRSASVAGWGKRERKSVLTLNVFLRYPSVHV